MAPDVGRSRVDLDRDFGGAGRLRLQRRNDGLALRHPSAAPSETAAAGEVIAWDQAGAHMGEVVTVEGPVAAVFYEGTGDHDLVTGRDRGRGLKP